MNPMVLVLLLNLLLGTVGIAFIFRTLVENWSAGIVVRHTGNLTPGRRIKIITPTQIIKGDILSIGPVRTALWEVGDGEHLPSIRTGRIIKVPNAFLLNNPIVVYGDVIVDEVIAQVKLDGHRISDIVEDMRQAIRLRGHKVVGVSLYQKDDRWVVHGVFEVETPNLADERGMVLQAFWQRQSQRQSEKSATPS
ncbi:MAG: hypothetical protein NZ951_02195 [Dehalococcoidia bacterium]|nr:hypothetical protein [Dehalococcoidia bacterium]MDW8119772.1 hypothetical protein [Chloroflexota bacterium]